SGLTRRTSSRRALGCARTFTCTVMPDILPLSAASNVPPQQGQRTPHDILASRPIGRECYFWRPSLFRSPRGTQDVLPEDSHYWRFVEEQARRHALRCGYGEIRTPTIEETSLFL